MAGLVPANHAAPPRKRARNLRDACNAHDVKALAFTLTRAGLLRQNHMAGRVKPGHDAPLGPPGVSPHVPDLLQTNSQRCKRHLLALTYPAAPHAVLGPFRPSAACAAARRAIGMR